MLFNLPDKVATLAAYVGKSSDDGEDPLISALFNSLGIPGFPGGKAELLHPNPYGILYESLRQDRAAQQIAVTEYLKKWYKSKAIKGCYWYNGHASDRPHPEMHLGYWAFETGMLTVLNKLDDTSYRNLNFYPRDLVDYGKERGWHDELHETLKAGQAK